MFGGSPDPLPEDLDEDQLLLAEHRGRPANRTNGAFDPAVGRQRPVAALDLRLRLFALGDLAVTDHDGLHPRLGEQIGADGFEPAPCAVPARVTAFRGYTSAWLLKEWDEQCPDLGQVIRKQP